MEFESTQSVSLQEASNILEAGSLAKNKVVGQFLQRRHALTIRVFDHFTKDVNFDIVKPRLEELADKVKVLPPLVESPMNSVWWGPGSSLEEAKAAALIAVSAGVQIRQICHSQKPHPHVTDLIQIGGSTYAKDMPVLSVEEMQNLNQPRCENGDALAH